MRIYLVVIIFCLLGAGPVLAADEGGGFRFSKDERIKEMRTKKPVRIELKRKDNGKYSWELTGDDVDEIMRVDKKLREYIKREKR